MVGESCASVRVVTEHKIVAQREAVIERVGSSNVVFSNSWVCGCGIIAAEKLIGVAKRVDDLFAVVARAGCREVGASGRRSS